MTHPQPPVAVEQRDRDAAADWNDARRGFVCSEPYRRGTNDSGKLVQAFARHRLAERERCAKVAEQEALEALRFAKNLSHPSTIHTEMGRADSARNIAAAIRAGKEPA